MQVLIVLQPEAVGWEDAAILEYWQKQQRKVIAFACGLHERLGAKSTVSSLDESMFMHFTNEVLGGWDLIQLWQLERVI